MSRIKFGKAIATGLLLLLFVLVPHILEAVGTAVFQRSNGTVQDRLFLRR